MAMQDKRSRIDAQWQALQPGWGNKDYDGERKLLHDTLDDDENIDRLWAGGWKVLVGRQEVEKHDRGVVAFTGRRVVFLNKGRLSKNVAKIPYWGIETVEEVGPDAVRFAGFGKTHEMRLGDWGTNELTNLVRSRLPTDAASFQVALSDMLGRDESIEFWTRCAEGGLEIVAEDAIYERGGNGNSSVKEKWWEASVAGVAGLALVTDRRFIFSGVFRDAYNLNVPFADLLTVQCQNGELKFAALGLGLDNTYVIRPSRKEDAEELANLMQTHLAAQLSPDHEQARIFAEWRMRQPVWSERKKRNKERNRLPELMEDGERLQGLLGGSFKPEGTNETSHDGVVVATDRRLIFVSESVLNEHVGELPYEGVSEVLYEEGGRHKQLRFMAKPGYPRYSVDSMDQERPHNTRQTGYPEEFAVLVDGLIPHLVGLEPASADPASESASESVGSAAPEQPAASKYSRINAQWRERSPEWQLDAHKNEREKLFDVLSDDEDIERLINGIYKTDVKGAEEHNGVVAATDQRLVFVYKGMFGEHLDETAYGDIERVEFKEGFWGGSITIVGRAGASSYLVSQVHDGTKQFVACVESHLAGSPTEPVAPASPAEQAAPVFPTSSRRSRTNVQWQDRSPNWDLKTHRKEREKLVEVLFDDEDIERLVWAEYNGKVEGVAMQKGVIAATDRRLVFVGAGFFNEHLFEVPYTDIESVEEMKGSLLAPGPRLTITLRASATNHVVNVEEEKGERYEEGRDLFADCVRSHIASPPN